MVFQDGAPLRPLADALPVAYVAVCVPDPRLLMDHSAVRAAGRWHAAISPLRGRSGVPRNCNSGKPVPGISCGSPRLWLEKVAVQKQAGARVGFHARRFGLEADRGSEVEGVRSSLR